MGIFFAILSPAIFGINNYIDKFLLSKHNISPTVITIYGGIFAFITGLIILYLTGYYPVDIKTVVIILASGFLTSIYLLPYYKALDIDETSYVIPILQTYPIFVLVLSFIFLGESLSLKQYLGSIVLILGACLLSVEKTKGKLFSWRKASSFALLSGFLFSLAQVLYKFGVTEIPFWNTLPYEGFGIALGALAIGLYKGNFKKLKKETRKFPKKVYLFMGVNEFGYLIARYTGYFAISLVSVSLVSVLAGFQPLFVLLYGVILSLWLPKILKEVVTKKALTKKLASILFIFIGLYLIFF